MTKFLSVLSALVAVSTVSAAVLGLALIWLPKSEFSELLGRLLWSSVVLAVAGGFIVAVQDALTHRGRRPAAARIGHPASLRRKQPAVQPHAPADGHRGGAAGGRSIRRKVGVPESTESAAPAHCPK